MKTGAGIATLLLGLSVLSEGLAATEDGVPAKPTRTQMHDRLNQLIRAEHGIAPVVAAPTDREPPTGEILQLEPIIVEGQKLPDQPPPETKAEKFIRTGTLWQKVGRTFTRRFWMKGDNGIMFTLSW